MTQDFTLHPRLAADTAFVADWCLCRVLLMNDARFPWLILVPRQSDIVELFDLGESAQQLLVSESAFAARALKAWTVADKINIAALGNLVAAVSCPRGGAQALRRGMARTRLGHGRRHILPGS